jgi:hypothetical protein
MTRNLRASCRVRQWSTGAGLAAAAAAMIGMGTAHADTLDELLIQSEDDMTQTASLYGGIDPSLLSAHEAADQAGVVSALQNEADLIAQIQSQQDALPEALQSSSQLLGDDQQLATASGDLLSAMNTFVNAADAGDFASGQTPTLVGDVTGYFAKLDFVYAEVFQVLPAELNAEFATAFAPFNAEFATAFAPFLADVTSLIDPASAADITAGLDPSTAIDPGIFADLVSSIGL